MAVMSKISSALSCHGCGGLTVHSSPFHPPTVSAGCVRTDIADRQEEKSCSPLLLDEVSDGEASHPTEAAA